MTDEMRKKLGMAECLLFAAGDSVAVSELAVLCDCSEEEMDMALEESIRERETMGSGLLLRRFDDKVQLCTRPEYAPEIFAMLGSKGPQEISRAMMEALAIVAYRQPVTRAEVEELRGVNSSYIIGVLQDRGFIEEAGHKATIGSPVLFRTTEQFLRHFGLSSIDDLPTLPEKEEKDFGTV